MIFDCSILMAKTESDGEHTHFLHTNKKLKAGLEFKIVLLYYLIILNSVIVASKSIFY